MRVTGVLVSESLGGQGCGMARVEAEIGHG